MIVNSRTLNKIISRSENLQRTLLDLTEDTVDETNLSRGETAHDKEGDDVVGRFQIDDAEAWAIGTRNGVLVGEDDITYHNNSKYYSQVSNAAAAVSGSAMMVAGSYADRSELSALASADSALMSENYEIISGSYTNIAGSYMNIAGERAKDSEAWAIGKRGGALVPPSDPTYHNNSKYYYEQSKSIAESLVGVLRPKGTCLFSDLPLIADSQSGDLWNIEDEFTTTSDFREGAGRIVAAGSDVYLTVDLKWDVLAGTTSDYIGCSSSTAAIHGLVPPAQAGQEKAVFYGDGTWEELPIFRGVSGSIESIGGMLPPAPQDGEDLVFKGNGQWGMGGNDALIAPVEKTSISTNVYAIGEQFVYGGILCKAIAAIAVGDTFVLNTNYQLANDITTQIKAIVDAYVTGVKGNSETDYRTGNANLTLANIASDPLGIANGGTGATTESAALTNLVSQLESASAIQDSDVFMLNRGTSALKVLASKIASYVLGTKHDILVYSLPASTTSTYANALSILASIFFALSEEEKNNAYIMEDDSAKLEYTPQMVSQGIFTHSYVRKTSNDQFCYIISLDLSSKKRTSLLIRSTGTLSDQSSDIQTSSLALYVRK